MQGSKVSNFTEVTPFNMHTVKMTSMGVLGRNTHNSFVFCNFNKITTLEYSIGTFRKSQGPMVIWGLFQKSYYTAKFEKGQNDRLGSSSVNKVSNYPPLIILLCIKYMFFFHETFQVFNFHGMMLLYFLSVA